MTDNETRHTDLLQHLQIKMERAVINLRAVEGDLQMLGSKFSPKLHEINAQIDELRRLMDQYRLDQEAENERERSRKYFPMPVDPQTDN